MTNEAFELWLRESVEVLIEYKRLLRYWERIYDPRSPIDKVADRYIESLNNRGYTEYYLDQLLYGTDKEKFECYDVDRDYPLTIKARLDSLDTVSRKASKRAM